MRDDISLSGVELVIQKLIELTQDDKLTWSYKSPKEAPYIRNAENAVFFADFEAKTLALAKRLQRGRRPSTPMDGLTDKYDLNEFYTISLMIVDTVKSLVLWEENDAKLVSKLYSAVSFKVSEIESLIEAVLNQREGLAAP
ncbi:MAG: hypothetical protein ACPGWR_15530 [Ardenticatenaceae bacterium]